jgi:phage protein U
MDLGSDRYNGGDKQLAALRAATLNGNKYSWIDGLKQVNQEAYYYWNMALS